MAGCRTAATTTDPANTNRPVGPTPRRRTASDEWLPACAEHDQLLRLQRCSGHLLPMLEVNLSRFGERAGDCLVTVPYEAAQHAGMALQEVARGIASLASDGRAAIGCDLPVDQLRSRKHPAGRESSGYESVELAPTDSRAVHVGQ